jgi:hypothetical protein
MKISSIALAIKTVFEAVKEGEIARCAVGECPIELQLPPYLSSLLHSDDPFEVDYAERENAEGEDLDGAASWGPDMSFAWRLPSLTPWKALLRLDDEGEQSELYMKLRGPQLNQEDRELAEQLLRFLEMSTVTLWYAAGPSHQLSYSNTFKFGGSGESFRLGPGRASLPHCAMARATQTCQACGRGTLRIENNFCPSTSTPCSVSI